MGDDTEYTFRKLEDDTVQGGVANRPDGCAATQRDMNSMEKWANTNLVKFSKGKCKALLLERNNPRHQHRLGATRQKSSCAEKDLGVLVGIKLTTSLQSTFKAKEVNSIWAALGKTLPAGQGR
ncbi:mitochondrial enolase superfamily member 1 [Grus japonensis]|uniref:Mitochondrial enolase superfamily member 1 n=1 Tax=Grus japonensis TaxID=30415 RepID=A0ABC9W5W4_GRUJA